VRPWQHVLDCLNGYLTLVDALLDSRSVGQAYNFGPGTASFVDVGSVATRVAELWGGGAAPWSTDGDEHPHEANLLALDARKAELELGWHNVLGFDDTLAWTVGWARRVAQGEDPRAVTLDQVAAFDDLAKRTA
jgi:CDP-glucose 4,6-dehydratase